MCRKDDGGNDKGDDATVLSELSKDFGCLGVYSHFYFVFLRPSSRCHTNDVYMYATATTGHPMRVPLGTNQNAEEAAALYPGDTSLYGPTTTGVRYMKIYI